MNLNETKINLFRSIYGHSSPLSMVTIALASLPTERYKRNVIRGKLDLVSFHCKKTFFWHSFKTNPTFLQQSGRVDRWHRYEFINLNLAYNKL